jgi:diacylglycerol kinase family enzyme
LFLTDDFLQAEKTVDRILSSGEYDVIFTAGGDGTIVYLINAIEQRIRDGLIARDDAPPVGVLKMGTGNALATYLDCRDVVEDLRAVSGGSPLVVYDVSMIETNDELHPFAGFGYDAQILNDYDSFKESVRDTPVENYATGLGGYAASIVTRSIPSAFKADKRTARVTSRGHAVRIEQDTGAVIKEYEAGDVIFEGRIDVLAASTIPYWGFKIRMFNHCARLPGHFQLRCFTGGVIDVLTSLHTFWDGRFPEENIRDFLVEDVQVEITNGAMAYHVAGDPAGFEREVEWKIAPRPARLAVPLR